VNFLDPIQGWYLTFTKMISQNKHCQNIYTGKTIGICVPNYACTSAYGLKTGAMEGVQI